MIASELATVTLPPCATVGDVLAILEDIAPTRGIAVFRFAGRIVVLVDA